MKRRDPSRDYHDALAAALSGLAPYAQSTHIVPDKFRPHGIADLGFAMLRFDFGHLRVVATIAPKDHPEVFHEILDVENALGQSSPIYSIQTAITSAENLVKVIGHIVSNLEALRTAFAPDRYWTLRSAIAVARDRRAAENEAWFAAEFPNTKPFSRRGMATTFGNAWTALKNDLRYLVKGKRRS